MKLYTKDKIDIDCQYNKNGFDSAIIVCPGFFNSKKDRWIQRTVEIVSLKHDSIVFDFRGHGASGGRFSWTAKEYLDLEAVVDFLITKGYKRIGVLAFSLGAVSAVNFLSRNQHIKSAILISCPLSFWKIDYHFWEPQMLSDLKNNIDCKWEGKGVRLGNPFLPKLKPIDCVRKIKSTELFFVHGDRDWVIKDYHSRKLFETSQVFKKKEIIKNGLHAERLIQQYPEKMHSLIMEWFASTL
jgi:pimeloyl-ACP methyl ester carboxylesterase